ncbi:MAG: SpoIID/LytB domain-containing protein [Gaiellaceae bacterium]
MRLRVAITVTLLAAATAATSRAGTTLLVAGHGWGHGVGMSQWGAYGYARHGWRYKRILFHYYPGTSIGHSGEPYVRVLLAQNVRVATVGCAAQLKVTDGRRFTHTLKSGTYGVGAKLVLPVRRNGVGRSIGRFAVFSCARAPLTLDGRPYHGALVARGNGRTVSVVNLLQLDDYVRGVVPSESPSRWPLAELEAQAVAARSYAMAELKPSRTYDLLPDTRDQVYGGVTAERPHSNVAVRRTHGQILMWNGQVARTYYSSSSGGRTESVQDAWPGSAPIPYLRSVRDPYDTYSPHHDWGPFAFAGLTLAQRLGLAGAVESARLARDASWRVATAKLRLSSGQVVSRSGEQIARALNLRSTWFSIGELALSTSSARVVYGRHVRVSARAIDAKGAVLQQRNGDGGWRTVRRVRRPTDLSVVPRTSTAFRLRVPGTTGTSVEVSVAPRLRVRALGPRLLAGQLLPRTAGPVQVWRLERGVWRVVSRPHLLPDGEFRTPLRLRPTIYRITAGGDGAFAPGLTRLVVTRHLLETLRR